MSQHGDILIFGFDQFGDWSVNPTELLVRELAGAKQLDGWQLHPVVLTTDYRQCQSQLDDLIEQISPRIVLGLGLTSSRDIICLERFAVNIDDSGTADNAGIVQQHCPIDIDGPAVVQTGVPLEPILAELAADNLPATISSHAGTFVCNHSYYSILRAAQRQADPPLAVFVHLPMIESGELPAYPMHIHWQLAQLRRAVQIILSQLISVAAETAPQP